MAASLEIDGRGITCRATVNLETCAPGVTSDLQEIEDCDRRFVNQQGAVQCSATGEYAQSITVEGTPKKVVVLLTKDGRVVFQREVTPHYSARPRGGSYCGTPCKTSHEDWDVPI
ncbi:MAG TPA: hypothetical protein VFH73_28065 [Polyangia bacterium]|nr:hypothetical protein [Polyangia bacterium]